MMHYTNVVPVTICCVLVKPVHSLYTDKKMVNLMGREPGLAAAPLGFHTKMKT